MEAHDRCITFNELRSTHFRQVRFGDPSIITLLETEFQQVSPLKAGLETKYGVIDHFLRMIH